MRREEFREEGSFGVSQRFVHPDVLPPTRSHDIQSGGRIVNPQFLPPVRQSKLQTWGGEVGAVGVGGGGPYGWDPPYRDFPYHVGNVGSFVNRRRTE